MKTAAGRLKKTVDDDGCFGYDAAVFLEYKGSGSRLFSKGVMFFRARVSFFRQEKKH